MTAETSHDLDNQKAKHVTSPHAPLAATQALTNTALGGPAMPSRARLRPLGPGEIRTTGGFWREYQELNAATIIDHCLTWMERIGWLANFDVAAGAAENAPHRGIEFVDSEVYKILEAMAWELGREPAAALAERYDNLVSRIAAAQEPDGYLNTSFGRAGQRARFSDLEWGHELYCFGHLIQAATARLRTGYDDALPAIARSAADYLCGVFGPDGRVGVGGHPEIEVALVEFGRATGEAKYLELARLFVDRRGTGTLGEIEFGAEYFQDDAPVRDAKVLRGHAVRALYLAAGAYDVAVETGDDELAAAVRTQWSNTVARRSYITGGMGSRHRDEAFGADFELPPDRAYAETCAGIASVMLSWRLLLDTGEVKYADLIERTLLNTVLVSPRADGRAFYYTNTLHQRSEGTPAPEDAVSVRALSSLRAPWFEVSCCPTNVSRTLASAPLYFATATEDGIQLHQYGEYRIDTEIRAGKISLDVASGYPFEGAVTVTVADAPTERVSVSLRAHGGTWECSDEGIEFSMDDGAVTASGVFAPGTSISIVLPIYSRFTFPPPEADAVRGQVAVERGPLVLALESPDLPDDMDSGHVAIDTRTPLVDTPFGARASLRRTARTDADAEWPYGPGSRQPRRGAREVELIPYFQWANRGPSTMRVFIPIAAPAEDVS